MSNSARQPVTDAGGVPRRRLHTVLAWVTAAVIGLAVPAGLVAWRWLAVAPAATGVAATATIADTSQGGTVCSPGAVVGQACTYTSDHVLVSYRAGGTTVRATVPVYDAQRYRAGELVTVRYDPARPDFAVIPSDAGTVIDFDDPRIAIALIWLTTAGSGILIAACFLGARRLWTRLAGPTGSREERPQVRELRE